MVIIDLHMVKITIDDVARLAQLSKLSLSADELKRFADELASIVGYVEQLSNVDVSGLEPTGQVSGLVNVMREDEIKVTVSQHDLLKNAPATENNLIKVRRVLE